MNQPACQPAEELQEQQQPPWLGHGSGPCDEPDGLLTPTQSCSSKHPDGPASSFHPATDLSNLLSQYVLNPSSFPDPPFSASDPSLGPCPSFPHSSSTSNYLAHSPQPLPARRATVSSLPSRLPHFNQAYHPTALLAPDPSIHSPPPPLDAPYNLLAGWDSTPNCFPLFNQPHHHHQLIGSPCKDAEFTIVSIIISDIHRRSIPPFFIFIFLF
ncbi:hypothetical protein VP01_100g9 [Puccinia sorghi]|uniref:Uncharacterized protein n=1 Tax=Puccinia sorghi TaxID=27349 RepID=A0A0L6VWG2_9BASI|nr:hypothetical protein VP01_100g9 [Puccinia sorghi]